jgi:hypothetical protein
MKDGGPVFPAQGAMFRETPHEGMTLRDYFAAHAPISGFVNLYMGADIKSFEIAAAQSYLWADAMLKARDLNNKKSISPASVTPPEKDTPLSQSPSPSAT